MIMTFSSSSAASPSLPMHSPSEAVAECLQPWPFVLAKSLGQKGFKRAGQRDRDRRIHLQHKSISWLAGVATSTVNTPSRAQQLVLLSSLHYTLTCLLAKVCTS